MNGEFMFPVLFAFRILIFDPDPNTSLYRLLGTAVFESFQNCDFDPLPNASFAWLALLWFAS